ncbi:hypothetical protein QE364_003118 [Nocardioides zeae]|uniref:Uncharacterized protein n=1 Tax=Nocardioides zeae TaxID=1457234 RepID=A0ACC6IL30_9ACTN|nr:hypothetical protein [Nocardioides zeae]MDR6211394.1 hypothetical protein [Nocardioides zeae]
MRDSITGFSLFNENKLARQVDHRSVLMVESDADVSLIGLHVDEDVVRCKPGFARTATLLAAQLHLNYGDKWVAAIVDRDVVNSAVPSNAFTTRFYDLEAEIFLTNIDSVAQLTFRHLVTEETAGSMRMSEARQVVESAIELARAIGWVRYANNRQAMGIGTASLPLGEVVRRSRGKNTLIEAAAEMACVRARQPALAAALGADATSASNDPSILIDVCNGHDLFNALRFRISAVTGRAVAEREFARSLHALVSCPEFVATSVFGPVQAWFAREVGNGVFDCQLRTLMT